jgi:chloride channel 3/4/5
MTTGGKRALQACHPTCRWLWGCEEATMLLVKVCCLLLAVGGGLCVGMESCFIHIAGCISFVVSGFFSKFRFSDAKFRELLTCACAAGISVAFGAPIGGVLFAYETLSSYFPPKTLWRSFFCAIVAELALKLTDPLHQGTTPALFNALL